MLNGLDLTASAMLRPKFASIQYVTLWATSRSPLSENAIVVIEPVPLSAMSSPRVIPEPPGVADAISVIVKDC
jgi:hypothetical protein